MTIRELRQKMTRRTYRPADLSTQPERPDGEEERDLTWWDLMSDLDPGWLAWSDRIDRDRAPHRWVA